MILFLLKSRIAASIYVFATLMIMSHCVLAQAGKDGSATVTASGVIYNRYSVLTASAASGTNTVTVNNITDLSASAIASGANSPYATAALTYGDLVMVIKMQGATITSTNTSAYGTITAYNNVGQYELQVVKGITGNVITFCTNLVNTYNISSTERVQVVRIPRLSALTVNSGASLTSSSWAAVGNTGGVIAVEVTGNAAINGTVTVSGIGYRGGVVDNLTTGPPGTSNYVNGNAADGGEKGESIVGFETDYDALGGRYDYGAPANGGGGGQAHNSGAGGGANGGSTAAWNGNGNPDNSGTNWSTAWDLEGSGFHSNTSSGGGRGGYSYGANAISPITNGPGNTSWGGDNRRNIGGFGGRPLTYSTSSLFLGGGGGAGDANNNAAQNGAAGGGIIYLLVTGNLSGSGSISANGATAGNTISGNNDAPGGGGGGGAIKLDVQGTISSIAVNANGGAGGNQGVLTNESEGPGGGGGGGYISVTNTPSITATVTGGANGTTASTGMTAFTPNGATAGGAGTYSTGNTFVAAPSLSCFPLPLTLISFNATANGQGAVQLVWTSEDDADLKNYELQQSTDRSQWQTIGIVPPLQNNQLRHQYTFNAGTILSSTFYRLKMNNKDDSYTLSEVEYVNTQGRLQVYASGNSLFMNGLPAGTKEVYIYNSLGIASIKKQLSNSGAQTVINISSLAKGIYFVIWNTGSGSSTAKFIKL